MFFVDVELMDGGVVVFGGLCVRCCCLVFDDDGFLVLVVVYIYPLGREKTAEALYVELAFACSGPLWRCSGCFVRLNARCCLLTIWCLLESTRRR